MTRCDDKGLSQLLEGAARAFLKSVDADEYALERLDAAQLGARVSRSAGVVAFSGPDVLGKLALIPDHGFLERAARPEACRPALDADAARAWTCELANRLMGQLKAEAATFGVTMEIGLPNLNATGASVNVDASPCQGYSLRYRAGASNLEILVLMKLGGDACFTGTRDTEAVVGEAGDMLMF